MGYINLPYEQAERLITDIFTAYGFSVENSRIITGVILAADLCGIESHGIQRLVRYDGEIGKGMVDIGAVPETVWETPVSAVVDAKKCSGQLVSYAAMKMAISKARGAGIGMVAVRASNHYGIAGYYTRMAAEEDLIGVCMTNSEAIMVPTNGRKAMLGTNPISVSMPAEPAPFVFDASTTVVPRGKLEVYNKKGCPLPERWAVDAGGLESVRAEEILDNIIGKKGGGILPLGGAEELTGGHKGYGFGMICELFTSVLAGGPPSYETYTEPAKADSSHCFWAIDYGLFGDKSNIRKSFSKTLEDMRRSPRREGKERIYIHGEKEQESCEKVRKTGIPANEKTVAELQRIAKEQGLDYSDYIGV